MSPTIDASRRLIAFVGPSGAGKDSVIAAWLATLPPAVRPHRARRTITRAADVHEDHEAIDAPAFRRALDAGEFALHWSAHGLHYGVRHRELLPLRQGCWVVLNGSRAQLPELRAAAPQARVVEIDAPAALRLARLRARAREDDAARRSRLARSVLPVRCDLRIDNQGELADAVVRLNRWWQSLRATETFA